MEKWHLIGSQFLLSSKANEQGFLKNWFFKTGFFNGKCPFFGGQNRPECNCKL
jgi:hypothetical protein